jgi:hypothetical protein
MCGKHAMRVARYDDPNYLTPELKRRKSNRDAQLKRFDLNDLNGYAKRNGRHEHRVVAEKMIGRPLKPGEVVHHIDRNKRNNNPSNLMVLPSQRAHIKLHRKEMLIAQAKATLNKWNLDHISPKL